MIEANFLIPQNADMCVREREEIGKKDDTHKQMFAFIVFVGRRLFTLSKNEKMPNYFLKGIQLKSMFFREERVLHCHDGQTLFTPNQPQSDIVPH